MVRFVNPVKGGTVVKSGPGNWPPPPDTLPRLRQDHLPQQLWEKKQHTVSEANECTDPLEWKAALEGIA